MTVTADKRRTREEAGASDAGTARRQRRQGPAAAAVLAVCTGVLAMAVFTLLDQYLNPTEWVPIPGKTPVEELQGGSKMILMWSNYAVMTGLLMETIIVWLLTWAIAHEVLARKRTVGRAVWIVSACFLAVGLLFTFPPLYNWLIPG
jgi:hypothetical protein